MGPVRKLLRDTLTQAVPIAVVSALIVAALAPMLLKIVFGPQFAGSDVILRLLCIAALFNFAAVVIGTALLAAGRFRDVMHNTLLATLILVIAKAALTARFGTIGAALATTLAEGSMMILQWRSLGRAAEAEPAAR